ncbi:hypothetical protein IV417_15180 [Alphaproteobacteria bacterium KMM 3653]|uniref:Uncharacterized protein n=1 Tax=Harenicola maris TaxID=2841044 RepID=A0AAP2CUE4_9RHOB|nr:hypothetical protein [Harenicola maris]
MNTGQFFAPVPWAHRPGGRACDGLQWQRAGAGALAGQTPARIAADPA